MTPIRAVMIPLRATRAESARLGAAIRRIAEAGPARRRRVLRRFLDLDLPAGTAVDLAIAGRSRQPTLRHLHPGPAPLVAEARVAAADLPAALAALGLTPPAGSPAAATDSGEAALDAPVVAAVETETVLGYRGIAVRMTARRMDAGSRIELSAAAEDATGLLALALDLHAAGSLPLDWEAIAAGGDARTTVRLAADADAGDAFRSAGQACLAQIVAHRAGVIAGAVESVHQMRVGIRRLRALIGLFGPALETAAGTDRKIALADLQRRLGPVRDWDVFAAELLGRLRGHMSDSPALEAAAEAVAAERRDAHALVAAIVAGPQFAGLVLDTSAWLLSPDSVGEGGDASARDFARRILAKHHRRLRRRGRDHAAADPDALHDLRIRAKKLRYAVEFFADLHPGRKQRRFLRRVKAIQDVLGVVNDASVAGGLAERVAGRLQSAGADPALIGEAVGMIRGWQFARSADERDRFGFVWEDYVDAARFWD